MKHLKTYEGFSKPKMVEKPEQIYFTNIKANDIFEAWKILEKHFNIPKVDSSLNIDSNLFLKSIKNKQYKEMYIRHMEEHGKHFTTKAIVYDKHNNTPFTVVNINDVNFGYENFNFYDWAEENGYSYILQGNDLGLL